MENELKVIVTADIKGLQAGLNQAEKNLKNADNIFKQSSRSVFSLENRIAKLAKEFEYGSITEAKFLKETKRLNEELFRQRSNVSASAKEVQRLTRVLDANKIKSVASATTSLGSSTRKMGAEVKGANTVALEFNRIIQDAPFGIMGVGNNLQQLTANFSNLSKNAGGTGKALKAAFASLLTGPNVALLAISALTTGLTVYSMWANKSKEATKTLAEELEKYRETLDQVNQAQLIGLVNARKESQSFENLRLQAENANIPLEERRKAVEALQQKYPKYLSDLSEEQILTGEVGTAYKSLTEDIIANSKARAASELIQQNSNDLLTLELQLREKQEERLNKVSQAQAQVDKLISKRQEDGFLTPGDLQRYDSLISSINNANDGLIEEAEIKKEIEKLNKTNDGLVSQISENIEKGARFTKDTAEQVERSVTAAKELKDNFAEIFDIDPEEINKRISDAFSGGDTQFKDIKVKVDFEQEQVDEGTQAVIDSMILIGDEVNKLETSFNDLIENNSIGILNQSLSDLGNQIVDSFETGNAVLDNFLKSVLKSVPQIVSAFSKLQAARKAQANGAVASATKEATADGVAIGTSAAKALGPIGLAVLPVFIAGALAIISSAFGKGSSSSASGAGQSAQTFGNTPGRQFGGSVTKGSAYIVGEKRPELFVPNTNGMIIPQVPQASPAPYGGNAGQMNIKVEVEGSISGETIRLSNKRASNKVVST
jgi:hypothetical protein